MPLTPDQCRAVRVAEEYYPFFLGREGLKSGTSLTFGSNMLPPSSG
jgi:hypothetical protein